jgi:hypothetical protein
LLAFAERLRPAIAGQLDQPASAGGRAIDLTLACALAADVGELRRGKPDAEIRKPARRERVFPDCGAGS